jgi:hypothetical protein
MSSDSEKLMMRKRVNIDRNLSDCRVLPTDYMDYGGQIERWKNDEDIYADCSCCCRWFAPLWNDDAEDKADCDFGACMNPNTERYGLLTFEHMAGYKCFEAEQYKK